MNMTKEEKTRALIGLVLFTIGIVMLVAMPS